MIVVPCGGSRRRRRRLWHDEVLFAGKIGTGREERVADEGTQSDRQESPHRHDDPHQVRCRVVTVSDTRSLSSDVSGREITRWLEGAGHRVLDRHQVPDGSRELRDLVVRSADEDRLDAILITGGTGIAPRDQTPEVIRPLLDVELPGFGEIFRAVSYAEIGPAAMLSRALAGRRGRSVLFVLPGSTAAVRTAMEKLILPVITHAVGQAAKQWPPA